MSEELKTLMELEDGDPGQQRTQVVALRKIRPNPYQPRQVIEMEKIEELAQSIKTYGLLQPVIVRPFQGEYQLVAGHRRMMACQRLGWSEIPAMVRQLSDSAMATVALIENLQRENLSFLEEAQGYERLLREFHLTQEVLAQRLGKSQSTIANKLRLLKLPAPVKDRLSAQEITERHARALLKLPDEATMLRVVQEIINLGYTVQQTERRVSEYLAQTESAPVRERKKVIIRDIRIFLNTVRQAVSILESGGLDARVKEQDFGDYLEVTIRLPKTKRKTENDVNRHPSPSAGSHSIFPGQ
jgi:ParB family transcriptional regulator, chromosome partitioning protein